MIVRLHTYDDTTHRALVSFRNRSNIIIVRWIRGPLARINQLIRKTEK